MEMEVKMQFDKETKRTVRYAAIGNGAHAIDTVYVNKSHLPEPYPQQIVLDLKTLKVKAA